MNNSVDDDMKQHPEDGQILEYLQAPAAPAQRELGLHLAGCGYCRRRTETMALLREQGQWLDSGASATDPQLADLLAGRLDDAAAARLRDEIRQDPARLRAALHYASHAQAMHGLSEPAPRARPLASRLLHRVGAWLDLRAPLWQLAPALAVMLAVGLVVVDTLRPERPRVIAFAEQSEIRFVDQDTQPGIGFFSQQGAGRMRFDGPQIELLDPRRLRLSWDAIDGVTVYKLKLQVFRDGKAEVLARRTLSEPVAELEIDQAFGQHRYEWVLSGETADKRSFQASGGFVVAAD